MLSEEKKGKSGEKPMPEHIRPPGIKYASELTPDMFYPIGDHKESKTFILDMIRAMLAMDGGLNWMKNGVQNVSRCGITMFSYDKAIFIKVKEQTGRTITEGGEFDRYFTMSKAFFMIQVLNEKGWDHFVWNTWCVFMVQRMYDIHIEFCGVRSIKSLSKNLVEQFKGLEEGVGDCCETETNDKIIEYCTKAVNWISRVSQVDEIGITDRQKLNNLLSMIKHCMSEMGCTFDGDKYVLSEVGLKKQKIRKAFEDDDWNAQDKVKKETQEEQAKAKEMDLDETVF